MATLNRNEVGWSLTMATTLFISIPLKYNAHCSAERDLERLYDLSLVAGEYVGEPLDLRGDLERDLDLDLDLLDELPPPP